MKIGIINGPNLNKTGDREKEIYGDQPMDSYLGQLRKQYPDSTIEYHQTNVEGEIINLIHQLEKKVDGIILNAGGYTHTSVAIADAVKAISVPVVELHISNIFSREDFRHVSLFGKYAAGTIAGFGMDSYRLAVEYFYGS